MPLSSRFRGVSLENIERNASQEAQDTAKDLVAEDALVVEGHSVAIFQSQKITMIVNMGLFLGIVLSVATLLPFRWPLIDRLQLRLFSSVAVVLFLDISFWLAGWPGSALGITLLGIILAFTALVGQGLGLVGAVFSFLGSLLGLLLMSSDLPFLKDGEWISRGHLAVYIGLLANLIIAVLSFVLWLTFGKA